MTDVTQLAHVHINGADELFVQLVRPIDMSAAHPHRQPAHRQNRLAAAADDSRSEAVPRCGSSPLCGCSLWRALSWHG